MQSQSTDLEQAALCELECPVCMEYMVPPITLCVNGHNICDTCKQKVRACPTCRSQLLNTRNVALEKLAAHLDYPCKYRGYGCKKVFPHKIIGEHHVNCRYRPQTCPVAKLANGICSWTGLYDGIKEHLKEKHPDECYDYLETGLTSVEGCTTTARYWRFIFAHNEVFFRSFPEKDRTFYAVLLHIGVPENAAKYKYKFEFVNKDDTEAVAITHMARSFTENLDDIFRSGNCGKLHCDVVSRLRSEEGNLKFKMEILKVGNGSLNAV